MKCNATRLSEEDIEAAFQEGLFLERRQDACWDEQELKELWSRMANDVARGYAWTKVEWIRRSLRESGAERLAEIRNGG